MTDQCSCKPGDACDTCQDWESAADYDPHEAAAGRAEDVLVALLALRSKDGHFGVCTHRMRTHLGSGGHRPGIDCPADVACGGTNGSMTAAGGGDRQPRRGSGAGCSAKCRAANAALGFLDVEQPSLLEPSA